MFNAIVWQDRRTHEICENLRAERGEEWVNDITGLIIDPYFSATKIQWILDHVEGARARAEAGDLLFGTIDSFLIWRMSKGASHVTDATNAARTMLYDIRRDCWSEDMCALLNVPMNMLPEVKDCADDFGVCKVLDADIPILGVAGDQQAALIGQACFEPGMVKSTYGTGCFAIINTGSEAIRSQHRLLTTIAYRLDGEVTYALEGSIFIAGAVVQWLRDGLHIISEAREAQDLAGQADAEQDVVLVPAFTGLGAPYWKAQTRGAIFGLTRATGPQELAKAALQSVGFQTYDLARALTADLNFETQAVLRVDGGMSASDYTMQFLADILDQKVDRPKIVETTVLGAAWLAGHRSGLYGSRQEFGRSWRVDKVFEPNMDAAEREAKTQTWKRAIEATMMFS